ANGAYSFTNLAAGVYTVNEIAPNGFVPETANVGTPFGGNAFIGLTSNIVIPQTANGVAGINYNFPEKQTPLNSISGYKFQEPNGNNDTTIGPNDSGVAGATVVLTGTQTGTGTAVTLTQTTAANGFYQFTGLAAGTYQLTETPPAGLNLAPATSGPAVGTPFGGTASVSGNKEIISNIVIPVNANGVNGVNGTEYNFPEIPSLANTQLSGHKFYDPLKNESAATDVGIPGVTMVLTGTSTSGAGISLTTTTDANGAYTFNPPPSAGNPAGGLPAGTYTVTEIPPATFTPPGSNTPVTLTSEAPVPGTVAGTPSGTPGNNQISSITITADANGSAVGPGINYNFFDAPANGIDSISGYKYQEPFLVAGEPNRIRDTADKPIVGGDLVLTGITASGQTITPVTTTTDATGFFEFTNLQPGVYSITDPLPAGLILTAELPVPGTPFGGTPLNLGNNLVEITNIVVPANPLNVAGVNYDFPFTIPPAISTVASAGGPVGTVINDQAVLIGGSDPTGTILFKLTAPDGTTAATEAVTINGAGTYNTPTGVTTTQVGAYKWSATYSGDAFNPSVSDNGVNETSTIGGGLNSISGIKFKDANRNDTFDNGDSGVAGATIVLTGTQTATGTAVTQTTTTGTDGSYSFTGLLPGSYTLTETPPANINLVPENPNVGTPFGGSGSVNGIHEVIGNIVIPTNAVNVAGVNYNFPEVPPLANTQISGFKFYDPLGTRSAATDVGIPGVTMVLTGTSNTGAGITLTTTTGANGAFTFNPPPSAANPLGGIPPGTYTITEIPPATYTPAGSNTPVQLISELPIPGTVAGTPSGTPGANMISSIVVTADANGDAVGPGINYDFFDTASIYSKRFFLANG
ncbi:MAG TPA: SdrD B-like domain-containing protein, partial [Gemmataceae bacterium]|nr:SdrD B-like domain-containing protein [Gemmataceae bacterium]